MLWRTYLLPIEYLVNPVFCIGFVRITFKLPNPELFTKIAIPVQQQSSSQRSRPGKLDHGAVSSWTCHVGGWNCCRGLSGNMYALGRSGVCS